MVSKRSDKIPPFIVMDVLDRACALESEGIDVVHMEIGEPDFDTPAAIVEAGRAALAEGKTHYTHSMGLPALRESLVRHYDRAYGVTVPVDGLLVTLGSSPAMQMTFAALLDPGDEVIVPDPGYPCYTNMIRFFGAEPAILPVRTETGFQYDPDEIRKRITKKTKAILVNSPANPTGCVTSAELMAEIANMGPTVISDEIYHGLTYGPEDHSIREFTGNAFVLGGFSKRWAMTGWRLGWVIPPREFVRPLQKLQQNFFISPADFVQHAGVTALDQDHPELAEMVTTYDARRRTIVPALRDIGFDVPCEPSGAFYVFADVSAHTDNCYDFAFEILDKAHVACTPGVDFGERGEGYLRFSYATAIDRIREGMDRIGKFLAAR